MKALNCILGLAVTLCLTACPGKSKSSNGSNAASQAASLTLTSSNLGLSVNGQATITATGGSGSYPTGTTTLGSLQALGGGQFLFTAPSQVSGTQAAQITVTDSLGQTGSISIAITSGASANVLSMYSTLVPIPVSGTTTLSVKGGTAPYSWAITQGGGQLKSNIGSAVLYQAPSAAGSVTVLVSDGEGHSLSATISISGVSQQSKCSGSFAMNAYGKTGTLKLVLGAQGKLTGSLKYSGSTFSLTGVCTETSIQFKLSDNTLFTGAFYYTAFDPYVASMVGTFGSAKQSWVAVPAR